MDKIRARGGVLLTSYGMITSNTADFIGEDGFAWDYVILDEGLLWIRDSIIITVIW